jgi:hypothetical protein
MRKFILVAAFALVSATAQAGDNRSLTLDPLAGPAPTKTADPSATAQAPQADETPQSDAPKYEKRPALVDSKTDAPPAAESDKPVVKKTASYSRSEKPRRQRYWTEGRIINELHRHGIYW